MTDAPMADAPLPPRTTARITTQRFRTLAQTYGANFDRWPENEQAAARDFAQDEQARALLEEEERLDALLGLWRAPEPSAGIAGKLEADLGTTVPLPALRRRKRRMWWSGLGIAVTLAGVATGSLASAATASREAASDPQGTAFGDFDQELSE